MIYRKTVFVLGAGASAEVELPLGWELRDRIVHSLTLRENARFDRWRGDNILEAALHQTVKERDEKGFELSDMYSAAANIVSGLPNVQSIDDYLNNNHRSIPIILVGKLAIAYEILKAEFNSCISIENPTYDFRNKEKVNNSWYREIIRCVITNCDEEEDLDNAFDNVRIINFNYDRSLRHYLQRAIHDSYPIDLDRATAIASRVEMVHPYGHLGPLEWETAAAESRGVQFGVGPTPADVRNAATQIKTYSEQVDDPAIKKKISTWLGEADHIVFLGFGFHEQNMNLLAFTRPQNSHVLVFATARGISDDNLGTVKVRIRNMAGPRLRDQQLRLRPVNCADFLKNFDMTLMAR